MRVKSFFWSGLEQDVELELELESGLMRPLITAVQLSPCPARPLPPPGACVAMRCLARHFSYFDSCSRTARLVEMGNGPERHWRNLWTPPGCVANAIAFGGVETGSANAREVVRVTGIIK